MFVVYGKENCPNCVKAKALLESKGETFEYIDITVDTKAREHLMNSGFRSVPQVYIGNHHQGVLVHVGGYTELEKRLS